MPDMTKRRFLKGAGLAGAALLAGSGLKMVEAAPVPKKWDKEVDVVVIGFGGTGAAAAIEAHDAGARVLILEKMPIAGGSTALSGGIVYAAGTAVQRAAGITDSPDGMYKFWMADHKDLLDPELLRLVSERSSDAVDWLAKLGARFPTDLLYFSGVEQEYGGVTPPVKRGHCVNGKGKGLMDVLSKAITGRKIEVLYDTAAERLIADTNGDIIGVRASRRKKGLTIRAKRGVVLASGGFARNKEMVKSYFPAQMTAVPVVAPGLRGDGILMAAKIGSPIVDTGSVELPPSLPAFEVTRGEKAIMLSSAYFLYKFPSIFVNQAGKRFCNETAYYQMVSPLILQQKSSFVVFDDRVKREAGAGMGYGLSKDLAEEIKSGILKQTATVAELAAAIGVPAAGFEETVSSFNGNMKKGTDPDFGRSKGIGTIETPPFYAAKLTVAVVETFGGVRINTNAQVLDAFNEPVRRLYAGGATTAILRAYPGSGAFLVNCFVFGRIAGKNAAGEKAWG